MCRALNILLLVINIQIQLFSYTTGKSLVHMGDGYEYKHHNNQELNEFLQDVNRKCPDITRLYELTERSVNGWPLTVIELSTNPGQHQLREYFPFSPAILTY